ncbi:MarR family winged helix-turn-helix transcriptional regulator [Flavihumibacter rivuli]|uniref:MarR family winged helix-turn-helix transcriptional regulator n=1 Tax=Flavihumibacter rivuli TaxID=2838156 RepID=UPI001BDF3218|nr:MarR family winged helix-turn-helix transcriptional regulator [Flavihumibacter rivuli]ULQ57870.1 MarR family winged helix-turn-helix transcriptional regulator [Flavihumibacter rivuli]
MEHIWQRYLAEGGIPDATAFGVWLIREQPGLGKENKQASASFETNEQGYPAGYEGMGLSVRSAIMLGRLERFVHQLSKPQMKAAGMSEDEFIVLATLLYLPKATKTQLLKQCLIEIPTGSELLKRMKRDGLVLEKKNPDDARSSYITISAKGRQQLVKAFQHLSEVEDALAALQPSEQQTLFRLLDKLDQYHSRRHQILQVSELMQGKGE